MLTSSYVNLKKMANGNEIACYIFKITEKLQPQTSYQEKAPTYSLWMMSFSQSAARGRTYRYKKFQWTKNGKDMLRLIEQSSYSAFLDLCQVVNLLCPGPLRGKLTNFI